ncbi:MAG: hypothetical protein AAFP86_10760 [Planctomycetota bacterium]
MKHLHDSPPKPAMRPRVRSGAALVLTVLLAACGGGSSSGTDGSGETGVEAAPVAIPEGTYEVRCGCRIEGIGHCGNYVRVDGDWLEIANGAELGLRRMEWCAAPADLVIEATVAGTRMGDSAELTGLAVH